MMVPSRQYLGAFDSAWPVMLVWNSNCFPRYLVIHAVSFSNSLLWPFWLSISFSNTLLWPFWLSISFSVGSKPATRGGWMGADQNFFQNSNRRPISRKSPKPSSVLAKVWNSYGKAKPTQKASNERAKPQSKSEANRETAELICLDRSDRCDRPIWPVRWTGLTGRAYRSDR